MTLREHSARPKRPIGWLLTLVLLALAIGYYFLYYRPESARISALRRELAGLELLFAESNTLPAQLRHVESELRQTDAFVREWRERSPASQTPLLLGRISQVLSDAQLNVTQFKPEASVTMAAVERKTLKFVCTGKPGQVLRMLADLESQPDCIWVEELKLQREKDAEVLGCELKLATFADKANVSD